jgi:hypothetical protein
VNGKNAQLEASSGDRGIFYLVILSRKFKALRGFVECESSCGQPGAVRFSINVRDILNI